MKCVALLAALFISACGRASDVKLADSSAAIDSVSSSQEHDTAIVTRLLCGVAETPLLTDEGIGELRQGRLVAEVASRCEVLSDSPQRGTEGMMERVILVRVAGETVRAVVADDRIFRLEINTPRFRTADSLGVDTPLGRIASLRGVQFAPGEDGVYGFGADHCGLSFRFSLPWRPPSGGQWTAAAIREAHGDAAVNRVIVIPCRR